MKNLKTLSIVVGTLLLLAVGFLFVRPPQPLIEIKAETITNFGFFPLANTFVSAVLVSLVVIALILIAVRRLSLVPSGLQNAVEAIGEAWYNICINTAGEKNGRRFFPVIMTIFTFIWIANWAALLPFFNAVGSVEKVTAEEFHHQAVIFNKNGAVSFIPFNQDGIEFDEHHIDATCAEFDGEEHHNCEMGLRAQEIVETLEEEEGIHVDIGACEGSPADADVSHCLVAASEEAIAALEDDGKELGVLIPYFRSVNTDVNSPLSIALMSAIFVEFWGITALGLFKYGSKFLNFSNPIAFFVGILEFVAEMARIVSFTFRLFGNLLAGEIVLLVMTFLVPFVLALPFYGLEVFVGVIQAFIFAMLTLVFGVLAVSAHEEHGDHGELIEEPQGASPSVG